MRVRDSGLWKDSEPWVRDGGVWKPAEQGFVRDAGVWKEFYSASFDPSTPLGTFIEGGYYIGTITYGGTTWALIVSPKAGGEINNIQWKTANTNTSGTGSHDDGWANTTSMNNTSHPMAQFCRSVTSNGFTDWYMPAVNELVVMNNNRDTMPSGQGLATLPGASSSIMRSSTQASAANVWDMNLANQGATLNTYPKNFTTAGIYVRAIRRVPIG